MRDVILRGILLAAVTIAAAPGALWAQRSGTVTGKIVDRNDNLTIPGAVVEYAPADKADQKKYTSSNVEGNFSLEKLPYGKYNVKITFMGYTPFDSTLTVNRPALSLGTIRMQQEAIDMKEVVVEGVALRTTQKGDTVMYNAGSYKVTLDASTDELLAKMPGIKVDGGNVEAHGEQVKKVLVDGKEFFGDDVTTAIKNLPAEVIDKIEVFDKLSDQAEFSGVDDGNSYKAINIVTQRGVNEAKFGRFAAGYGTHDLYTASASLNLFRDSRRISFVGMANNMNQQNFASDDLLGVMGSGGGRGGRGGADNFMVGNQSGVSSAKSIGVNYSNEWAKKLKLSASYFFNTSKNELDALTDREYFSNQLYNETSADRSRNFNHRINARVEYKINEKNMLTFRPSIRFQKNEALSADSSATHMRDGDLSTLLNYLTRRSDRNSDGYNISGDLNYMHRFGGRPGRMLNVSLSAGMSKNDQDNIQNSLTRYIDPDSTVHLDQFIANHSQSHRLNGRLQYSEPVSDHAQVLVNYQISYNYSDRDKRSYELPGEMFLDSLSNTYNSGYLTHRAGPGFRYNTDKLMLVANANYQYATLTGDQLFPTVAKSKMSADFSNVVYMMMMHLKFTRTNTLRIRLFSGTNNPSVTQLQDVLDVSNPLFVSQGNPGLRPVYSQNFNMRYINTNVTKGRMFMAMLSGSTQSNYIANSVERANKPGYEVKDDAGNTVIVLDQGAQYSRPVNLNGYWNVRGAVGYGLPVKWLGSNVNFDLGASYQALPTIYNLIKSTTRTMSYTGGIVVSSNISDKLDFTFSYNAGYNITRSSNSNEYFNGVGRARITWITWAGITLRADGSYSKYRGITDNFSEEFLMLNASIGKKLFKNQRGEISIRVNDILDRNKSFVRSVTDNYIQNVTSNVIGRYASLNFVYNLNTLKGSTHNRPPSEGGPGRHDRGDFGGRPPMGPPPGGGGGGMPPF